MNVKLHFTIQAREDGHFRILQEPSNSSARERPDAADDAVAVSKMIQPTRNDTTAEPLDTSVPLPVRPDATDDAVMCDLMEDCVFFRILSFQFVPVMSLQLRTNFLRTSFQLRFNCGDPIASP